MRKFLLALLLLACEDERGNVGKFCKPDGTCNGPGLECVNSPEWLGIPFSDPTCKVKVRK